MFVGARGRDFSKPIHEKRTIHEAAALRGFAQAFAKTKDPKWRARALEVHHFLRDSMQAPDGTWYSTQQDLPAGVPSNANADDYWQLGDEDRRKLGVPPIDHAVYTDQNGKVIEAYATLCEATAESSWCDVGEKAASALLSARLRAGGYVAQITWSAELAGDARKRPLVIDDEIYLGAQAEFGRALLALHRATGKPRWLDVAKTVAATMRGKLEDAPHGGFFARPPRSDVPITESLKPVDDGIAAARFLLELDALAPDEGSRASAERALRGLAARAGRNPALLVAMHALLLGPIEISVAGDRGDPDAEALFAAGRRLAEPRRVLRWDDGKKYPRGKSAAAYVCTRDVCLSPVRAPEDVAPTVAKLSRAPAGAPCATP